VVAADAAGVAAGHSGGVGCDVLTFVGRSALGALERVRFDDNDSALRRLAVFARGRDPSAPCNGEHGHADRVGHRDRLPLLYGGALSRRASVFRVRGADHRVHRPRSIFRGARKTWRRQRFTLAARIRRQAGSGRSGRHRRTHPSRSRHRRRCVADPTRREGPHRQ
jgi:hypothetical protein